MANYHILDGDLGDDTIVYTVVFHFPVPDESNFVGVNLRIAVSQDPEAIDGTTSRVPWLDNAHKTDLTTGEVYEWRPWLYQRDPGNTLVQDRAAIDAKYTSLLTAAQNRIRNRYKFWGYNRDVP